jgi:hypothetical protein
MPATGGAAAKLPACFEQKALNYLAQKEMARCAT